MVLLKARAGLLATAVSLAMPLLALESCSSNVSNRSNNPEQQTLKRLEDSERAFRMSANSYTADDPEIDHYYDRKAKEVDQIMRRLGAGEKVPDAEIAKALDTSEARSFPGGF